MNIFAVGVLIRCFSALDRARRFAGKAAFCAALGLAGWATGAAALEYRLPLDPIGPTSDAECHALYEQYRDIADALSAEASVAGDQAWAIVRAAQAGQTPESQALYRQASQLRDEAFRVGLQGSAARTRCMTMAASHQRNLAAQSRQMQVAAGPVGQTAAQQTGIAVARAGLAAYAGGQFGPVTTTRALAAATLGRILLGVGLQQSLASRDPSGPYSTSSAFGVSATSALLRAGQFNRLSAFMARLAVAMVTNLQQSAMTDLETALGGFDGAALASRFATMESDMVRNFGGGGSGSGAQPNSAPNAALREAENAAGAAYSDRLARSGAAIQRPAPTQSSSGGGGSSGGGTRYSATQCSQLLAQIREYQRVLPDYRVQGYGAMIEDAIRVNQTEYNRGC